MTMTLRLFDDGTSEPIAVQPIGAGISAAMSLTAFAYAWYFPIVLKLATPEKVKKSRNAEVYLGALKYWRLYTGDPPLHQIDETLLVHFESMLRETPVGRSGTSAKEPLGEASVVKYLKYVRAILFRAGPKTDPKRPSKGLLTEVPHIVISSPAEEVPRTRFNLAQARRVYACCDLMFMFSKRTREKHRGDGGPLAAAWWRAFVAVLFYTGLRVGTVLSLRWSMIKQDEDGYWLYVPGRVVTKTKKRSIKALRSDTLDLLKRLPRDPHDDLIFRWSFSRSHLRKRHKRLQRAAGITRGEERTIHAWKRTHVKLVGKLGIEEAMRTAQRTGDHSDAKTTRDHYCNLDQETAAMLPSLEIVEKKPTPEPIDPNQAQLF